MKAYALRHTVTQKFMPCRMFKSAGAGWSYWEPTSDKPEDAPFDPNPRIFWTEQAARNARTAWAQGTWKRHQGQDGGTFDSPPEYYDELEVRTPPSPRSANDLEIVTFSMELIS